jgi:hypothetical protein
MQGKENYNNKQALWLTRKVTGKHKQTMPLLANHHEHTHEQLLVHECSWIFNMALKHQTQDFLFVYSILDLHIINFNIDLIISMSFGANFGTVAIKKNWIFRFWSVNSKKNGNQSSKSF